MFLEKKHNYFENICQYKNVLSKYRACTGILQTTNIRGAIRTKATDWTFLSTSGALRKESQPWTAFINAASSTTSMLALKMAAGVTVATSSDAMAEQTNFLVTCVV